MAKYCMRCGEKNEDGVSVCKGCGMPLEETLSHNKQLIKKLCGKRERSPNGWKSVWRFF